MLENTPLVQPLGRRILARLPQPTETIVDGIVMPAQRLRYVEATVIRLGTAPEFEVKVGDKILVDICAGNIIDPNDENLRIMIEHEALCVIERTNE